MIELTLPWPPSVNGYWRHPTRGALAGRHLISVAGRAYRATVLAITAGQNLGPIIAVRCSVAITCYPPDRRRRDLDNILKSALDSLVHARAIVDDSLIDELHVIRADSKPPGHIRILIRKMEATNK